MLLGAWQHLDGPNNHHCPTVVPSFVFCDVVGGGGTMDEALLLQDFGKIHYYKVKITDPFTNTIVFEDLFRLKYAPSSPGSPWGSLGINSAFNDDLYYHTSTNEIVAAFTNTQSETVFTYGGVDFAVRFISNQDTVIFEVEQI